MYIVHDHDEKIKKFLDEHNYEYEFKKHKKVEEKKEDVKKEKIKKVKKEMSDEDKKKLSERMAKIRALKNKK